MRILFCLPVSRMYVDRCSALAEGLTSSGHEVKCLIQEGPSTQMGSVEIIQSDWANFDVDPIYKFNPSLIIVWNGYFNYFYAVVQYLKRRYRVVTMEMGWFRRDHHSYILDDLAQISALADIPVDYGAEIDEGSLEGLRREYDLRVPEESSLPDKYLFFPMQLEHDTQIVYTSPAYKTMDSVIGYIYRMIPNSPPIVIRNHPLEEDFVRPPHVLDMTKKANSMALAVRSTMVVGINSTVLAECLLFHKPIVALGQHVAKNAFLPSDDLRGSLDEALSGVSDRYKKGCDYKVSTLLKNQWDVTNPPGWIIDNIVNLDFTPRI